MPATRPSKIESALLYQDFATVAPVGILKHLNSGLEAAKIAFDPVEISPDDTFALFAGNGFHVMISQTRSPLDIEGFGTTLTSPYTQMTFPGADEAVHRHRSRIFITVGSGLPKPDRPKRDQDSPPPEPGESQGDFERKLMICRLLTNTMVLHNKPIAIHWCQSDQLMKPEMYEHFANEAFPTPLFVHPAMFSSREVINGTEVIGLRTYGAAHLIGREIVFNEAPVPFEWLYTRACNFVDMARQSGSVIPHGESFGASDEEIIRVRHRPKSEKDPNGAIELTLERCDEHNFVLEQPTDVEPAQTEDAGEVVLNLNDPIDRAIAERRRELNLSPARPSGTTGGFHDVASSSGGFGRRQDTRH